MCLKIGRIVHDGPVLGTFGGQAHHNPGEDTVVAPALPPVVEDLSGAILIQCVILAHPIAIDEDYAEDATIINARLAMALRKEGFQPLHLRLGQPEKVAYRSGLLVEPESRQQPEINGSRA